MILLDENIRQDQEDLLGQQGLKARRLIRELAKPGVKDPDIITLLHHRSRPTLFTHDKDFFKFRLAHRAYCLVWLDIYDGDAANFIRRFLRHPTFQTQADRMGKVIRAHIEGLHYWQAKVRQRLSVAWPGG